MTVELYDCRIADEVSKTTRQVAIFQGHEDIRGVVTVDSNKALEHIGIKIELFGVIG